MSLLIDPIWPWSLLRPFLSAAGGPVLVAVALAGLLAFGAPVLVVLRPFGLSPGRLLRGCGLVLVALLVSVALGSWGTSGAAGSLEGVGLALLLVAPLALAGLTVWTYLSRPGTARGRAALVLLLRLGALLLTALAVLRPSLAFSDRSRLHAQLLVAVDASESMTIRDESSNRSRWELVRRTLERSAPALERLREEHNVEVAFYSFAGDTSDFNVDDPVQPNGKRTDIGGMLGSLFERRDSRRPLRGLLVLSDGADNGGRPALAEAARWRNLPCPVHAFACGSPSTGDRQRDIAITSITTDPVVPVKGKMTVKLTIDAPGFENSEVRLRLFLDGKEVQARNATLALTDHNEVKLECPAPAKAGEVRVTVRVEDPRQEGKPPAGDLIPANNQIETFVNVSKEGVSVLLVDKRRAWEPVAIYDALAQDGRIRVDPVWLGKGRPEGPGDLFGLDNADRPYDVVILGDVTAQQMRAVNPRALAAIEKLVSKGAGFLMIGGYVSFGNSDWEGTEIEKVLPVDLTVRGQVDTPVRVTPTEAGLRKYGYFLNPSGATDDKLARAAWERLPELEGMARLGRSKSGLDSVLAVAQAGDPVLVTQNYGEGRALAFAGDTTYLWKETPEGYKMHTRFWRQMVLWLAKRENDGGSVRVEPDTRRLPVRGDLGFRVRVRSKTGADLPDATYKVEVEGPGVGRTPVATAREGDRERGTFGKTEAPGVYRIVVHGKALDPSTNEVVEGDAEAHFLVYEEELEMVRRAADHDFLKKLASAGGGEFHRVEDLPDFLRKLAERPAPGVRPKLNLWPDWRTEGRSPFFGLFFLAFVALLSVEWFLRRRWGMV